MAENECYLRKSETVQSETLKANSFNLTGTINNLLESSPRHTDNAAFAFGVAREKAMKEDFVKDGGLNPVDHIILSRALTLLKSGVDLTLNTSMVDSTIFAAAAIHKPEYSGIEFTNDEEKIWFLLAAARMDLTKYSRIAKTGAYSLPDDIDDTSHPWQEVPQETWKKVQEYGILISNLETEIANQRRLNRSK